MGSKHKSPSALQRFGPTDYLLLFFFTTVGGFLRLYQLGSQIVGDDEWHAIQIASGTTYQYILTHFRASDNCIPLTIIYKLFLDTIGLHEISLHFLQAATGTLLIGVFPFLIFQIIRNKHIATLFALLLALSPFLIYYSRFARPYILVVFLSFTALISFFLWLRTKNKWHLAIYILGSIISSYFSQVSFPSLVAPLGFAFLLIGYRQFKKQDHSAPPQISISLKEIVVISTLVCVGILLWLLPTFGSLDAISSKVGDGHIQFSTLQDFISMFSGFGNKPLALGTAVFSLIGLSCLYKWNQHFFYFVILIIIFQFSASFLINPQRVQLAHVFTRYNITCLPFFLLLISIGIWQSLKTLIIRLTDSVSADQIAWGLAIATITILVYTHSPLKTIYSATNNFTNHDDFQYGYNSVIFQNKLDTGLISKFYTDLANEDQKTTIIEFPFVLWWSGNFFHLQQQIHHKEVRAGFWEPYYFLPPMLTNDRVTLENFTNIGSHESLIASGAKYLVIHKDIAWEALNLRSVFEKGKEMESKKLHNTGNIFEERYGAVARQTANGAIGILRGVLGKPYFEDKWITVFSVPQKGATAE